MSPPTVIAFLASVLEIVSIYGLFLILDKSNYLTMIKLICYTLIAASVSCILNY